MAGPFFVSRDTAALIRVREVDDSYAYIETLMPNPSTYSMPLPDYDSLFVQQFRPATPGELAKLASAGYRPPANAPEGW